MNRRLVPVAGSPFLAQRLVIFFGSAWLLISWILVIGLKRPMMPTTETWLPGVRLMLIMAAIGLVVVWPMAAMASSQPLSPRRTLRETSLLLVTAQLITWPAGLVTAWTLPRTALIAITLTGWGLLAGAAAAWGRCHVRVGWRLGMMACCLLMLLAAPIFLSFDEAATWAEGYSPLTSLWSMAGDGLAAPTTGEWIAAGSPWVIAIVAWCLIAAAGSCDVGSKTGTSQT
ncbi:MAG: hypothetical protein VX527_03935 [Planctomycetota bacterium]|nr:hypothetical protein [Planctomycetota bacterium]